MVNWLSTECNTDARHLDFRRNDRTNIAAEPDTAEEHRDVGGARAVQRRDGEKRGALQARSGAWARES